MTTWKIELNVAQDQIPLLEEILYGLEVDAFPTLSDFEIIEGDNIRLLEAFFTQKPDLDLLKTRLTHILPGFDFSKTGLALAC